MTSFTLRGVFRNNCAFLFGGGGAEHFEIENFFGDHLFETENFAQFGPQTNDDTFYGD